MRLNKYIKIKLGKITLKNSSRLIFRRKAFHNFETAKTIGIVFDSIQTEQYTSARFLSNFLTEKKIKYRCLGFLKPHDISETASNFTGFAFFSEKDFNFFGKPNKSIVLDFCRTEFDILIDLHPKENYFIDAIMAFSVAKMKVGLKNNDKGFYDLMINLDDPVTSERMIEQIKIYLNNIKA